MPAAARSGPRAAAVGLIVLALVAFAGLAAGAHRAEAAGRHCADARAAAADAPRAVLQHAVVCLVNRERAAHGLPALVESARLDRSAQGWTNAMVGEAVFSHGADFAARITAAGFHWSAAGENIATGYPTPASVVSGWMASPGHCANILSPVYREVGTGVSGRAVGGTASGPGTWAQDFGLGTGQSPASSDLGPARTCDRG